MKTKLIGNIPIAQNTKGVKRTFFIPEKLDKALKLQALMEGKTSKDVLVEALNNYIKKEYIERIEKECKPVLILNSEELEKDE
ncbi:hypothetical protein Q428_15360 [Fervidicella metallireducens AeB]|uniref:CopG family transcriptional regulator n=1 Tax=Fervidicella metallireducens AeB TaxID=1403537 RepID=A0A017RQU7_9CLOT|nr:hypothetical protein [Fervidicella metallireducens]EYE87098.1 hypothetical protein Q428_15360 [Fervidicella metallireducens AeB]